MSTFIDLPVVDPGLDWRWLGADFVRTRTGIVAACVASAANGNHGRLLVAVWDNGDPAEVESVAELEAEGCYGPSVGRRRDGTLDLCYHRDDLNELRHRTSRDEGRTWSDPEPVPWFLPSFPTATLYEETPPYHYYPVDGSSLLLFFIVRTGIQQGLAYQFGRWQSDGSLNWSDTQLYLGATFAPRGGQMLPNGQLRIVGGRITRIAEAGGLTRVADTTYGTAAGPWESTNAAEAMGPYGGLLLTVGYQHAGFPHDYRRLTQTARIWTGSRWELPPPEKRTGSGNAHEIWVDKNPDSTGSPRGAPMRMHRRPDGVYELLYPDHECRLRFARCRRVGADGTGLWVPS